MQEHVREPPWRSSSRCPLCCLPCPGAACAGHTGSGVYFSPSAAFVVCHPFGHCSRGDRGVSTRLGTGDPGEKTSPPPHPTPAAHPHLEAGSVVSWGQLCLCPQLPGYLTPISSPDLSPELGMGAESRSRSRQQGPANLAQPSVGPVLAGHSLGWGRAKRGPHGATLGPGSRLPLSRPAPGPGQQELLRPMAPPPQEWRGEGFLFKCGTQGFCKPGRGDRKSVV